jgi:hypothetical protein
MNDARGSGNVLTRITPKPNLPVFYYRVPPSIGIDGNGNDKLGGGAETCDDAVVAVTPVSRVVAVVASR